MNIETASQLVAQRGDAPRYQWIDVRSPSEYGAGHLPRAVNIPVEQVEARLDDLQPDLPIVLVCQSGKRARMVAGLLEPCRKDVTVLEGGTAAWKAAGHPVVANTVARWSLERQVRLIAGLLVLAALILSFTVSRYWLGLAAFVGLGLTFAGATDLCPMAALLVRMPWNRSRSAAISAGNQPCAL